MGGPAQSKPVQVDHTIDELCDLAAAQFEVAAAYVDDGAFRTASARLRQAAELLDRAADVREKVLGIGDWKHS